MYPLPGKESNWWLPECCQYQVPRAGQWREQACTPCNAWWSSMPPAYKMKDNAVRALLFLPYPCHQADLFFFFFLILSENSFFPISYCARHLVHGTGANSPNLNRSRACEQNTYQAINLDHSRRHHNLFGRSRLRKRPHRSCDSQFHDKILTSGGKTNWKKNPSRRKVTIINSSRRSKTRIPRTELQIATATNKTKHNTPAKALTKQTNKAPQKKNQRQN